MKRVPGFQEATGVYKKAIRPYQSWYERSEMSPIIEWEGRGYRHVMTLQQWRRVGGKKMLVCDEQGEVASNKAITRHCRRVATYLSRFIQAEPNDEFYLDGGKSERHEPTIQAMAAIKAYLADTLTESEREGLEKHQAYLEEHYRISQQLMRVTERQMACRKKVENLPGDKLTPTLVDEVVEIFDEFTRWGVAFKANVVSNREGRKVTWALLKDKERMGQYPNKEGTRLVLGEIFGSDQHVRLKIEKEEEYKMFPTEEEYLHFLRHEADEESYIQEIVDEAMTYDWVFSPKCKWLR